MQRHRPSFRSLPSPKKFSNASSFIDKFSANENRYSGKLNWLDGPIVSKNGLQFNRKCPEFIFRYCPCPLLSTY